jgi:hypothetical protein
MANVAHEGRGRTAAQCKVRRHHNVQNTRHDYNIAEDGIEIVRRQIRASDDTEHVAHDELHGHRSTARNGGSYRSDEIGAAAGKEFEQPPEFIALDRNRFGIEGPVGLEERSRRHRSTRLASRLKKYIESCASLRISGNAKEAVEID